MTDSCDEDEPCPADADEVTWITDRVAITNFYAAHQRDVLAKLGIGAILCLDQEVVGGSCEERGVGRIDVVHLVDGPNDMASFARAVTTLDSLVAEHGRVLVHCRAGRSRSVAVVAAWLKQSQGIGAEEALELVKSRRTSAVAPELVRLVQRY